MNDKQKIIRNHLTCTCDIAYTERNMVDLNCFLCNYENEIEEMMEEYSKSSYSIEQVRELLQKQKEATVHFLGYNNMSYVYPQDYSKIEKFMLGCPLII
mgnify:CR=1 FL=1